MNLEVCGFFLKETWQNDCSALTNFPSIYNVYEIGSYLRGKFEIWDAENVPG